MAEAANDGGQGQGRCLYCVVCVCGRVWACYVRVLLVQTDGWMDGWMDGEIERQGEGREVAVRAVCVVCGAVSAKAPNEPPCTLPSPACIYALLVHVFALCFLYVQLLSICIVPRMAN